MNFQMFKLVLEKAEEPESNFQPQLDHRKTRELQKNIYFCFIDDSKVCDCVHHNKLENSSRDEKTRPPDLPPEKLVCRSRSNS